MIKKYIGRDCELSTTGRNGQGEVIDPWQVTRDVLRHIDAAYEALGSGKPAWSYSSHTGQYGSARSMDCLRHWGPDGACQYADLAHVELCTAEALCPRDFSARCFSALIVAEQARVFAERGAEAGTCYSLSATNADAWDPSISWGTHLNVTVSTDLWEDLFVQHMHPGLLGFVASAVAAAIPFFGAGYIIPLKDGSALYSLSARAHHITRLQTLSTTTPFCRGLLNTRHEPHGNGQERLHMIGFDFSLIGAAPFCSFIQCILAAAEEGYCQMAVYDPVGALQIWSRKIDLSTGLLQGTVQLIDGRSFTLPGYIGELAQELLKMCEAGLISEEVAPQAKEMLPLVIELARYAEEGSLVNCARHLDWAAKLLCLQGIEQPLHSAESRLLDHDFANTNLQHGTLWRLWEQGLVDPLIQLEDALESIKNGPAESRAWARGQLIQRFHDEITSVGWDHVELRLEAARWGRRLRIDLPALDSCNQDKFKTIVQRAQNVAHLEYLMSNSIPGRSVDPILEISNQLATSASNEE